MRKLSIILFLIALVLVACSPGNTPVVSMSPSDGVTDVALDATITATLREPVDPNRTEEVIALFHEDGSRVDGTVEYDPASRTATFDPAADLQPGTSYTVVVMPAAMSTASSNSNSREQRWTFTTVPGMVLVAVSPADGAIDVSIDAQIVMEFRNSVAEAELRQRFELTSPNGTAVLGTLAYDSVNKRATFTPESRLAPGVTHTARIKPKDSGNSEPKSTDGQSWSFVTAQDRINLETHQTAAVVLGRFNEAYGYYPGGLGDSNFNYPRGNPVSWNGSLYLPDRGNNRVLVYHARPQIDGEAAAAVIGQEGFNSNQYGSGAAQQFDTGSASIASDNLVIADRANNRVLIWNGVPGSQQAAATVLGQSAFGESAAGCSAAQLNAPASAHAVDGRLIVVDSGNHRLLVWNELPTENGQAADLVIGQASFSECSANRGDAGASAGSLDAPGDAWTDGQLLIVADSGNNRLLIWDSFPAAGSDAPSVVLGQSDFFSNASGVGADRLNGPSHLASNGSQLFVADTNNNRVLVWDELPRLNSAAADVVLGQGNFSCNIDNSYYYESSDSCDYFDNNWEHRATHQTMYSPSGLQVIDGALLVADGGNNRYMIFDSLP